MPCYASGWLFSYLSKKILLWKGTGRPGLSSECWSLRETYWTVGKKLTGAGDGSDTLMIGGSL